MATTINPCIFFNTFDNPKYTTIIPCKSMASFINLFPPPPLCVTPAKEYYTNNIIKIIAINVKIT